MSSCRRALLAVHAVLSVLAVAACTRPAPYTVRESVARATRPESAAAPPPRALEPGEPPLRVLLFGDFGKRTAQQRAVASMIVEGHRRRPFDLAFSIGDNVYDCGLDPTLPGARECRFDASENTVVPGYDAPRDPRFEEEFERRLMPLATAAPPLVVHGVLGNHDVAGGISCREGGLERDELARVRACLQVAQRSAVWRMPARHYVVDRGPARFVVLDSNLLLRDYGGFSIDGEVAFLREAAQGAAGRTVFVVAHHPAATAGSHHEEFQGRYLERLGRLLEAGGGAVAAWFAGHDHDLQHVRRPDGLDVFVSGNGALWRPGERFERVEPPGARRLFGSTEWGIAVLEVSRSGWSVTFEVEGGKPLQCCRAAGSGPCEPVACPGR